MKTLPGYSHYPSQVCKLCRALYGLKQALHGFFTKFNSTIGKFSFKSSAYNPSLFIRKTDRGITFLYLYVDDMVISGSDIVGISYLKQFISQHFEMKDLGRLNYLLGLKIFSNSTGYYLY